MNAQRQRARGFTIVEVMVALAIAGILIGLALPAFNGFVAQRRLTAQVNDFLVAVQYARSEAGKRGETVSMQAVDAGDDTNEWGAGYCVVVGNPGNCDDALREFPGIGASTLNASGGLDAVGTLTFNARGLLAAPAIGANETVDLCDPEQATGRRVTLSVIGRVSSQELDCP
jgi:type IV fimbrial biogenesis protein FimT